VEETMAVDPAFRQDVLTLKETLSENV